MRIMVTGGAGFIGSNVVDGYIEGGHDVTVVDSLYTGKKSNVHPKARFYELDIRSPEVHDVMKREKPDILNHHAAQISVPASVSDPLLDADINIKGFLNLLEGAVRHRVKKVIFISSGGAIYGEATEYPTSEDYPPRPLSPYAVAKYASEHYLAYYAHQYGLDYTTLRYANIYGPRQVPHGEAGVVAIFMNNILKGKPSILYHFAGEPEGMIRDYCFVGDVVGANLAALERGSGGFFNIGTGRETTTSALYGAILEVFREARIDVPEPLSVLERELARPGDLTRSCLVVEKARRFLQWAPQTHLGEGLGRTLAWLLDASTR
jgi:UDP-glucose 4-epimerase